MLQRWPCCPSDSFFSEFRYNVIPLIFFSLMYPFFVIPSSLILSLWKIVFKLSSLFLKIGYPCFTFVFDKPRYFLFQYPLLLSPIYACHVSMYILLFAWFVYFILSLLFCSSTVLLISISCSYRQWHSIPLPWSTFYLSHIIYYLFHPICFICFSRPISSSFLFS